MRAPRQAFRTEVPCSYKAVRSRFSPTRLNK